MSNTKPSVTVSGLGDLKKALEELPKKLQNKVLRQALRKGAKVFKAEVKARSPEETGAMKASVKIKAAKRKKGRIGVEVNVTGGHEDAIIGFTEFGRLGQQPNPFIRNSFTDREPTVKADLLADIKLGIETTAAQK